MPNEESIDQFDELLTQYNAGSDTASELLWGLIYKDFVRIVSNKKIKWQNGDSTHQAVAEAIKRVLKRGKENVVWNSKKDVYGYIATVVERVIIEFVRKYKTNMRDRPRVELNEAVLVEGWLNSANIRSIEEEELAHVLMKRLKAYDSKLHETVYLKHYGGRKRKDIAIALGITPPAVGARLTQAESLMRGWALEAV